MSLLGWAARRARSRTISVNISGSPTGGASLAKDRPCARATVVPMVPM